MTEQPPPMPSSHKKTREEIAAARRERAQHRAGERRGKDLRRAGIMILVIAIMQLLFGVFFGWKNKTEGDEALVTLADYADDATLEVDGVTWNIVELREQIARESILGFVVPLGLGIAFLGLWWWAKRSPLPAMITALVLFVMAHLAEAVADPSSLAKGLAIKVIFLVFLVGGIKAALAARDAAGEPDPA